jgi:hypothetical protein
LASSKLASDTAQVQISQTMQHLTVISVTRSRDALPETKILPLLAALALSAATWIPKAENDICPPAVQPALNWIT